MVSMNVCAWLQAAYIYIYFFHIGSKERGATRWNKRFPAAFSWVLQSLACELERNQKILRKRTAATSNHIIWSLSIPVSRHCFTPLTSPPQRGRDASSWSLRTDRFFLFYSKRDAELCERRSSAAQREGAPEELLTCLKPNESRPDQSAKYLFYLCIFSPFHTQNFPFMLQ